MFRSVTAARESSRSGSRIWGQSTKPIMPTPTDYLATLNTYQDPANGTVSWYLAQICADLMGIDMAFSNLYGPIKGQRVDFGEFAAWAIAALDG